VIVRFGANLFIQPQEPDDRLLWRARDVEVEDLPGGFTRTVVYRDSGVRIVTVRDPYGDIISRTRYLPDGREVVLIGQSGPDYAPLPYPTEIALPPLVVPIPRAEYIVETRVATPVEIETALTAPPVETVERAYTLEEVRGSDRLRDKMRRVDLDTITFEFGSAVIETGQLDALDRVGEAIEETLRTDPDEVFLIEGHTDAVGSAEDNLVLSDRRAEAVAVALSEDFDIPPENLVTQGYGEDQLKLVTEAPERQNRRVALRRITPLLRGVARQQ
jgi:outer membrane protein OmpA-like peptidoglycan-associated protein